MRGLSLTSRFLATLLATCVLPLSIVGWFTLQGVRELIDSQMVATFVPRLAADHAQQIEDRLRQIRQACSVVREIARRPLESQQEPAAFAEQLDAFAEQIGLVPDLLDNHLDLLLLADGDGRVVYWQDGQRLDPSTRGRRAARMPRQVADRPWFRRIQEQGGTVQLDWGTDGMFGPPRTRRPRDPAAYHLGVVMDVPRPDGAAGALYALVRWPEVQALLDATREVLVEESGYRSAEVFLVDPAGVVQGHTNRARYGEVLEPAVLRDALAAADSGRVRFTAADGRVHRCGYRRLDSGGVPWVLGLSIPEDELFAATDAFLRVLGVAILVTILVLVVWSLAASRAIARPVRELVAATARVASGDLAVRVPEVGGPELGGLALAFNRMAAELAAGRGRLALAEREQAWAEMARQVAHEIRNPLTPMRMAAQMLLRARAENDPREREIAARLARTVEEQTAVLDRIATDFRHFAGAPRHEVVAVPLDDFLREAAAAVAELFADAQVELELDLAAGQAQVRIDRSELQRVFVNLVQNAVQAHGRRVRIASTALSGRALIRIADDGRGIPADVQPRLFQPYFTTRTSGTGLGLAISRRLVESLGGTIGLESTGSHGSVFRIELPLSGGAATTVS